ncbi:hypothetical protein AB4212_36525, partial [Streptomyces sp. 2MCAF27]
YNVLVEISAHPVLVPALRQSVADGATAAAVLSTMRRAEDDRIGVREALSALARLGVDVRTGTDGEVARQDPPCQEFQSRA